MASTKTCKSEEEVSGASGQLRQLEQENQELEESLKLQLEFLRIHMQVGGPSGLTPGLIERIQHQQSVARDLHSRQLLASQVRAQEGREMGELIKSYEARIADLRAMLASKEAEIAEATEDEGTDTLPRRENLRRLNLQGIQKHSILKALHELKKINVETEALEHCLRQKAALSKAGKEAQKVAVKGMVAAVAGKDVVEGTAGQGFKQKIGRVHQDKLLMKVCELLEAEAGREEGLRRELGSLREEWEGASRAHRQLLKRYKRQTDKQVPHHYCEDGDRGLNFLEELERVESQSAIESGLFQRVDLNVGRAKGKAERRRERSRASKEN